MGDALDELIVENMGTLVVALDCQGRIVRFNRAAEEALGYAREQVVGRMFWEMLPDFQELMHAQSRFQAFAEGGPAVQSEYWSRTRDGRRLHLRWSASQARDACGSVQFVICTGTILGERGSADEPLHRCDSLHQRTLEAVPEAQEALRVSEERFRAAFTHAPVGVIFSNLEGRLFQVNAASCAITGYSEPELLGRHFSDFIHPDDHAAVAASLAQLLRGDEPAVIAERRYVTKSRQNMWVQASISLARDAAGRPAHWVVLVQDISARRKAQDALQAMNERLEQLVAERTSASQEQSRILRSVLQSMGEAVIVADRHGTVFLSNPAAARIAGGERAQPHSVESCARPKRFFRADGTTEYAPEELPLARAVRGEEVREEEMFIARDGGPHGAWISASAMPLKDEDGAPAGGVLVARDTTERRHVDQLLRDSERHHREIAERNRLLVREVDHRVRNNIAGLLGLVAAMQDRVPDVQAFARAMDSRLRAMAHVHQLLARTEWGPLELRLLVESTLASMEPVAPSAAEVRIHGPQVNVRPRHVLPLTLILVEWLTNSCKYGVHSAPGGSLEIGWEVAPVDRVRLRWRERGGPPVRGQAIGSLGTELVRAFATRELAGSCDMQFNAEGADHALEFAAGRANQAELERQR